MKKISINCRSFLVKQYTGIGRYAINLVKSLAEIDQENKYFLYAPTGLFDWKRKPPDIRAKNVSIKMDWFKRGVDATVGNVDIYHSPSPDVVRVRKSRVVVTVHDLVYKAFPQGHTQRTLELTDEQCRSFMPTAAKIICCSTNTANDVKKYFGVEDKRLCVIYPGINNNSFYQLNAMQKRQALDDIRLKGIVDPFILFVGTIEPRKNLRNLLEAFSLLKRQKDFAGKLVVIGMAGWKSEGLDEFIDKLGIRSDVISLGFVTNDELRNFYNLAEVFVFPSLYEGYGYPIAEAFHCGAAVVTSNAASCPEVAGDAALIVDPNNPRNICDAIHAILEDKKLKQGLIERGLKRASQFNYLKTAQETLKVYKEI